MSVIDRGILAGELKRAGHVGDPDAFLSVLRRVVRTTAAIPERARDLMAKAGVDTRLLDPAAIDEARMHIAVATVTAEEAAAAASVTTQEAAVLLGTPGSNIRRSIATNRIYSVGRDGRAGHRLPTWQFVGGKPLPYLADVLAALPSDLHPLEVRSFFTTPADCLGGLSPAQWLATGGHLQPVRALADGQARQ
jgi:hypothetical protein